MGVKVWIDFKRVLYINVSYVCENTGDGEATGSGVRSNIQWAGISMRGGQEPAKARERAGRQTPEGGTIAKDRSRLHYWRAGVGGLVRST